jgi:hypothetical protein
MPRKEGDKNFTAREHRLTAQLSMEKAKRADLKAENAALKAQLRKQK